MESQRLTAVKIKRGYKWQEIEMDKEETINIKINDG